MSLRPDELANLSEQERDRKLRGMYKGAAGTVAGLGTAAGLGASLGAVGMSSKILPFLSEYIPIDLAIKGISKVSPKIGNILKKGQQLGLDVKEGLDFVKGRMEQQSQPQQEPQQETEPSQQPEPDKRNIIEQYSPELHNFLEKEIAGGRSPLEAAALATLDSKDNKFKKIIDKMVKDHKTSWSSIIQSVYGAGQQAPSQPQQQQQQIAQQPQSNVPAVYQPQQGDQSKNRQALIQSVMALRKSRGV